MKQENYAGGYALITGATGGLGKAFAEALAKRKCKLLLTGRSEEKLIALKNELLEKYALSSVEIFACDLANEQGRYKVMEQIRAKNYKIRLLVNVAGADVQKALEDYTQEKITFQCRVNLEGAMSLCRLAIAYKAKTLEIVNISSVSGIYPMPYFAVYSATKRALWSFSVSLREETKKDGVKVTAVLPGAMPTRQDICAQIEGQGLWGKLAAKSPQFVVQKSLKAVRKNKRTLIPGFWNKVMYYGTKLIPLSWKLRFIAKRWSKISKDAF